MKNQTPCTPPFSKTIRILGVVMAAVIAHWSSGCKTPLYTPAKARTQEEAASTHLAVLSVAHWDVRKGDLQPTFVLNEDAALLKVLPYTLGLEEKLLDALAAKLKVSLPGSSFSSTDLSTLSQTVARTNGVGVITIIGTNGVPQTTLTAAGGAGEGVSSSNQRSNTETTSSGNISNISFQSSPQGSNVAAALPGASVLSKDPQKDAMLQYWAAAALFQEVKLINHYVEDAAIASKYVPYLVRLQVSIMPRKRDLPYDAYSLLSFFQGRFATSGGPDTFSSLPAEERKADANSKEGVKVLPLLVTDNLEAALHSRSVDNMRQLALALSGVVQGVGLGADLQKVSEQLRTVVGNDFNSTFSVGRISDNTVQCRFGALNQAAARFAMIPQAHNVTLLMLVPRTQDKEREPSTRDMRVISKTELVHAITGKPLFAAGRDDFHAKAEAILEKNGFVSKTNPYSPREVSDILRSMAANDFRQFTYLLTNHHATETSTKYYESIWIDLCQLRNSSQLGSVEFEVPPARPKLEPRFLPDAIDRQTVVAVDNGKVLSVSLYWLENIQATKLGAFIELTWTGGKKLWPVTALEVQNDGRFINLAFPSPASLGYTNADGSAAVNLTLFSLNTNETFKVSRPTEYRLEKNLVREEKPSEKPGFDFAVPATVINAQKLPTNGIEGSINVIISEKTPVAKILLAVDKADVRGILPADKVKPSGASWELATNGTYTIQMGNLSSFEAVQFTARDAASKAGPTVKTVRVQFNEK